MRQVFSSPRLENVERVAALLREAGIETRVTQARSYKGGLRGDFSYRDHVRTDPAVTVRADRSKVVGPGAATLAGLLSHLGSP